MLKYRNNNLLIAILFICSSILVSAYLIQYKLGHQPCKLCVYERVPYILSILLLIELLFFKKYQKIIFLVLSLIFIIGASLSFYHFGIEQGFFDELFFCETNNVKDILTKEQLLDELSKSNISCKDVSFRILGLSLATINSIFSVILSFVFIKLFMNFENN
jgi:disulfide bond formation protein DsbB